MFGMRLDAFSFAMRQDITKHASVFGASLVSTSLKPPRFELLKNSLRAVVERQTMAGIDGSTWI